MILQPTNPMVKRQGVVLTQALNISHFKTAQFGRSKAGADRHELAIGKHVTINKGRSSSAMGGRVGNPVVQEHTAGSQQVPA
jgi:hypothetical protein